MRRFLLVTLLNTAAMALLVVLVGGPGGTVATRPDPQVAAAPRVEQAEGQRIVPPLHLPMAFHGARGLGLPSDPEPIKVTDAETGESIVVPDFVRYLFEAREGRPSESPHPDRQAIRATDVRVLVYREPRTLEEARALVEGRPGALEAIVRWLVYAPRAEAQFLREGLSLADRRTSPSATDTLITLSGGVTIRDHEEGLVVEGDEKASIELEPGRSRARGRGVFVVRHEAFAIEGEDLELAREKHLERVHVKRNVVIRLLRNIERRDGRAVLDFGGQEFRPGHIVADGGALLVREEAFGRERLQVVLEQRVHAEQGGGRSLDAERVTVVATRPLRRPGGPTEEWQLRRFEAAGGAILQYPDVTEKRRPFLIGLRADRLVHEVADDGTGTTLLDGQPRVDLHGDIPLQGFTLASAAAAFRAEADEQAWLGAADPSDVPPGADPQDYLRLVLRGNARLERRDLGLEREWDRLEGHQLTMLLRKVREPAGGGVAGMRERLVATSFALLDDVALKGTRMSGMTHRLVGEGLDTDAPVLVAEGPNTSFAFHGLKRRQRLLGGSGAAQPAEDGREPPGEREAWVVERLRASGALLVRTSFGGPTVGVPARLEGEELAYDRVSDRARLQGGVGASARLSVGEASGPRHSVSARSMLLERGTGVVRADGDVRGTVYVSEGLGDSSGLAALGLPGPFVGDPLTFGVATNGRIEIRGLLSQAPRAPRLDADQVIRIDGDVVVELTAATTQVDSLRASSVEVALRRTVLAATDEGGMAAGLASARDDRRPSPALPQDAGPRPSSERIRWDLTSDALVARLDAGGLVALEAVGQAVLSSTEGEIRGRRIAYDAHRREAVAQGPADRMAQAIFGPETARNEVWAPDLTLSLGARQAQRLVASAPAVAVLIRTDARRTPPRWERFTVRCSGPVVVESNALTTDGLVEIERWLRLAPGAAWTEPARLWADHLVVTGRDLLAQAGADVQRVVAHGPSTTFQFGAGDALTRVWGDRFELDVPHSLATLTGGPTRELEIHRGPSADPQVVGRQRRIVLDLETGMIRQLDQQELILRGSLR